MKPLLVTTALLGAWAQAGPPPSVQECVAASGAGQEQLKKGALFAARRALEVCSDAACPQVVVADCTRWLEEVMAAMPSLNIVVRINGIDQPQVRVKLDGAPWFDRLTGRPVDIEPGPHDVVVEVAGVPRAQRLVVVQGEKNRVVLFQVNDASFTTAPTLPVSPVLPPTVATPPSATRGFPTWPVVFTSGAVVGAAGFTVFGLLGKGRLAKLVAQPCAATKTCDPAEAAAISREFITADVSLVVGLASAVAAGGLWWWWAQQPEGGPAVTLLPLGTSLQVVGTW